MLFEVMAGTTNGHVQFTANLQQFEVKQVYFLLKPAEFIYYFYYCFTTPEARLQN